MSNNSHVGSERSIIQAFGHQLAVDHPGDVADRPGPMWVFIHGIAVSSSFWAPLMPETFRENAAWLSVSLPVHSPSRGPDGFGARDVTPSLFTNVVGAALNRYARGREVIIVGHSTGGFAGLCLALSRPEQVVGVVSVGGFADGEWTGLEGDMQLMAQKRKYGVLGPHLLKLTSRLTTRWPWLHMQVASAFAEDKRAFLADKPTRQAFARLRQDARTQDEDQLIAFFAGIRRVNIWDRLHCIAQPVLVLDGMSDPVIPRRKTEELASILPNGELRRYDGVGHMVMNERRERFWKDISEWGETVTKPDCGPENAGPATKEAIA